MGDREVAVVPDQAMTLPELIGQVKLIQQAMEAVMTEGEHYGKIPGCGPKPSLLKPGAEKLTMLFRLTPEYEVEDIELGGGHLEVRVKCKLRSIRDGQVWGEGLASASTMETKWRFRTGPKELSDAPVPREYWDMRKSDPAGALSLIGGKGHSVAKNDAGAWVIARQGERVENDNPHDERNTVRKMAAKRAQVAAVLTATAASDIFTQDLEELADNGVVGSGAVVEKPEPKPMRHPEDTLVVGAVSKIEVRTGSSARGPWTLTTATVKGDEFSTFDKKTAAALQEAHDEQRDVEIKYARVEKNGKARLNIETARVVREAVDPAAVEAEFA